MRRMAVNSSANVDGPQPARFSETGNPDLFTIAAIAIVATVITSVIHEGLGHGGMCVATGAHPMVLSTVHFQCSEEPRLVAAGGTLANLFFGALFWAASRLCKKAASWRYLFWLLMAFNLFDAGGYFLFSGVGNFGDWAEVVAGWNPAWAWRLALIALGTITYFFLFVPLCLRESLPFLPKDPVARVKRARQLMLTPYLTAGILSCVAGALNPVGPVLILLSAAAASFGGKSGLAWMWTLLRRPRILTSEVQMPEIHRNWGWMAAAIVLAGLFIAVLGPGVKFRGL